MITEKNISVREIIIITVRNNLRLSSPEKQALTTRKKYSRSPAVTQNYELSIAGGGEKTTFLASLRYQDDQGIIKESSSQIYSWRLKVDTKIKKWLKAGLNMYGHYRRNKQAPYQWIWWIDTTKYVFSKYHRT